MDTTRILNPNKIICIHLEYTSAAPITAIEVMKALLIPMTEIVIKLLQILFNIIGKVVPPYTSYAAF